MKAAIFSEFGGPEVVRLQDMEVPEPGPGEVRVAVRAAAMNHLDLWIRRGLPIQITMPHIGGSDVAGLVDGVGPGVHGIQAGTRVVVDPSLGYGWYDGVSSGPELPGPEFRIIGEHTQGGFAEFCVVPAANLVEVPAEVPFEKAAAGSLVGVTAWRALMIRGAVRAGESVLITGASGGVSTMAVQMARLAGARVFAVTKGAENVDRVRASGGRLRLRPGTGGLGAPAFQGHREEGGGPGSGLGGPGYVAILPESPGGRGAAGDLRGYHRCRRRDRDPAGVLETAVGPGIHHGEPVGLSECHEPGLPGEGRTGDSFRSPLGGGPQGAREAGSRRGLREAGVEAVSEVRRRGTRDPGRQRWT